MSEDASFYETQVNALLDSLYGAALRLAKNRTDAEDLVAEALTQGWDQLGSLRDRSKFRAWLFRITMNCFLSECRRKKSDPVELATTPEEPEFSIFEKVHQPFLLWWSNPEQEFINGLLKQNLENAIDSLPESFRVVLILVELEGFSYDQTSEILDIPVGTVRSRLARARGLLQKSLWADAREAGIGRKEER